MLTALKIEATTPYEEVLQYFVGGGGVGTKAIQQLFGKKGGGKSIEGERKARFQLIRKNGYGIDELAHNLWENASTKYDDQSNRATTQEYREAIENVLLSFNSRKQMAIELVNTRGVSESDIESEMTPEELAEKQWYDYHNDPRNHPDYVEDFEFQDETLNHLAELPQEELERLEKEKDEYKKVSHEIEEKEYWQKVEDLKEDFGSMFYNDNESSWVEFYNKYVANDPVFSEVSFKDLFPDKPNQKEDKKLLLSRSAQPALNETKPIGQLGNGSDDNSSNTEETIELEGDFPFQKTDKSFTTIAPALFKKLTDKLKKAFPNIKVNVVGSNEIKNILGDSWENIKAQADFEGINNIFNNQLKDLIKGNLPKGTLLQLGNPTRILQSAGIPNLPIELNSTLLEAKSKQKEHPFELSEVTNISQAIQNPVAVFDSSTMSGRKVIFTELQHTDTKGKTKNFIVALELDTTNKQSIQVNEIRSIYPRNDSQILKSINNNEGAYIDKEKMLDWISKRQFNSDEVTNPIKQDTNLQQEIEIAKEKINSFENPKQDGTKFQVGWHGSNSDFDMFDSGYLYSGEGASGFGEGFHFSIDKDDAKGYARKLETEKGNARLYKSIIPKQSLFLDLNNYIDKQSKFIQDALLKLPFDVKQKIYELGKNEILPSDWTKKEKEESYDYYINNLNGRSLFDLIKESVYKSNYDSESKASSLLSSIGIKGNTHTDFKIRHFIVFNEDDIKISKKTKPRFLRTPDGKTIYGFVKDGQIYIDKEEGLNANTPIHEMSHVWVQMVKQQFPQAYKGIIEAVKREKALMDDKRKEDAYKDLSDNDLADEVLASLVGNKGEKDFLKGLENEKLPIGQKLKKALEDFWKRVKQVFTKQSPNIKNWSMEQFQNAKIEDIVNNVTADLLGGKKVSDVSSEDLKEGRSVFNKIKEVKSIKEMMGKLNDNDLLGYMEQNSLIKRVPCA